MSTDFSNKERLFIADLKVDTGRDLAAWMAAITGAGLLHRNEIIDWLRQRGFTFSRASWIERIHHNGGKLIYANGDQRAPASTKPKTKAVAARLNPDKEQIPQVAAPSNTTDSEIDQLLAAAKAYRPLAQALVRDILAAVPGADARAAGPWIVFSHDSAFAAVHPTAKDVRLMLGLGDRTNPDPGWSRIKARAERDIYAALSDVLVLTDARQLTPQLRTLILRSAQQTG